MNKVSLKDLVDPPTAPVDMTDVELSAYSFNIVSKRKEFEAVVKKLKIVEDHATTLAKARFMAGHQKVDMPHGSYSRTTRDYMKLPETGWPSILEHCVQQVNNGMDPIEAFDMISLSLKTSHFKELTPDELPLGIERESKHSVKFNPKKSLTL